MFKLISISILAARDQAHLLLVVSVSWNNPINNTGVFHRYKSVFFLLYEKSMTDDSASSISDF